MVCALPAGAQRAIFKAKAREPWTDDETVDALERAFRRGRGVQEFDVDPAMDDHSYSLQLRRVRRAGVRKIVAELLKGASR